MNIYEGNFKNNNYHIAIVASKFNEIVTHHLVDGAIASLKQFGVLEDQIDIYWVPGAFEIGFIRALHKPVVLVPFTTDPNKDKVMNLMLAQGVTTIIDGNTELEQLARYDFNAVPAKPVTGYKII